MVDVGILHKGQRNSIKKEIKRSPSYYEGHRNSHLEVSSKEVSPEDALKALLEEESKIESQIEEEIEAFIKKTNLEMDKEQEDIRKSYEEDIRGFEGKPNINLFRNGR